MGWMRARMNANTVLEPDETVGTNPAVFSDAIIDNLHIIIPRCWPTITHLHDPYAGEGTKLGRLCDELGLEFSGGDLEKWKDRDERVVVANAINHSSYPTTEYAIVTSPTYNNGVNDHFLPREDSTRLTYRVRAG